MNPAIIPKHRRARNHSSFGQLVPPLDRLDILIAAILFLAASAIAFAHLQRAGLRHFYQSSFGPAVTWACRGDFFGNSDSTIGAGPSHTPYALSRFLAQQVDSFDCKDLPDKRADRPLSGMEQSFQYTLLTTGMIWRVTGVRWDSLNILGALLAGLSGAFLFALCRLFVTKSWAISVTAIMALSPYQLDMLPQLRDYSKQPFLFAFLLSSGCVITSQGWGRFHFAAASAGFFAAIGLGFRTDLLIAIPFFVVVLAFCLVADKFQNAVQVGFGALVFAAVFLISAFPLLTYFGAGGGGSGHMILLGLATPFNHNLGLTTPIFDIGHLYNDAYIFNIVREFAYSLSPQGIDHSNIRILDSVYERSSNLLLLEYIKQFPADAITRVLAAITRTANLEFSDLPHTGAAVSSTLLWARSTLIIPATGVWLVGLAAIILLAVNFRLGIFYIAALLWFAGMGALQFAYRHVFYLEFFYWLSGAVVINALLNGAGRAAKAGLPTNGSGPHGWASASRSLPPQSDFRPVLVAVLVVVLLVAGGAGLLAACRGFQQASVARLIGHYLQAPRESVVLEELASDGSVFLKPTGAVANIAGVPSLMNQGTADDYYFVVSTDGARCASPVLQLKVHYAADQAYFDFSRTMYLVLSKNGSPGYAFIPVGNSRFSGREGFGEPGVFSRFTGFSVPVADRACLLNVEAVTNFHSLGLPLWLRLPPDWKRLKLYQAFSRSIFPGSISGLGPVAVSNPSDLASQLGREQFKILSLGPGAWETVEAPARLRGVSIEMKGIAPGPATYAAVSKSFRLLEGSLISSIGKIESGGLVLGLLDRQGQWATTVAASRGEFQAVVRVPAEGDYRIVLAHNLAFGESVNVFTVSDTGLLESVSAEPPFN
jgi:hypothetical protein